MFNGNEGIYNSVYKWTVDNGDIMLSLNGKPSMAGHNTSQVFARHLKYNPSHLLQSITLSSIRILCHCFTKSNKISSINLFLKKSSFPLPITQHPSCIEIQQTLHRKAIQHSNYSFIRLWLLVYMNPFYHSMPTSKKVVVEVLEVLEKRALSSV
jgi:hypothetical protein